MKILLYCTKGKPYLYQGFAKPFHTKDKNNPLNYRWHLLKTKTSATLNGKVIGECDFEVEEINFTGYGCGCGYHPTKTSQFELAINSCLYNFEDMDDYLKGKSGYAIHIKNLKIYDTPKELNEYFNGNEEYINKAPQNMMYCNDLFGKLYALISIRPEWLCKILNGEKTIEIRKKVLKEMLKL